MGKFRILSLDGGGIRGLMSARLLQRLADEPSTGGWLEDVDLIAGTSTGGIIALGLAHGLSPAEICDFFIEKGPAIFSDSLFDNVADLGNLIGAQYSAANLTRELAGVFGKTRLGDLRKKVVIPTFDLDNEGDKDRSRRWKPKIFHNCPGPDSDAPELAANVARYTSAAPTYFPTADGYIDGGVFANNPSVVAIAQAISSTNGRPERVGLDDIVLISVGTGINLKHIAGGELDWGLARWARPLVDILMEGVSGIADYQSRQLLADRYLRIQIELPKRARFPLDAVNKIPTLDRIARAAPLEEAIGFIAREWR